jgi:hypothetical protein
VVVGSLEVESDVDASSVVVGSVSASVVAGSVSASVEEPDVVSSVAVLTLLASTAVPSSADAAKAPPRAAPSAKTRVATNRRPTDRAMIDPRSCSRERGVGGCGASCDSPAKGSPALAGRRSTARNRKAYPRQRAAFRHEKAL